MSVNRRPRFERSWRAEALGTPKFSKAMGANIINSLPDSIVMVDTINQFKNRLDKYWKNYDFVYDHRATYTGTRGRF